MLSGRVFKKIKNINNYFFLKNTFKAIKLLFKQLFFIFNRFGDIYL